MSNDPAGSGKRQHKQLTPAQRSGISARLKEVLGSADSEALAAKVDIPSRTLSRYKVGGVPELAGLMAIADACGISIDWLLNARGSKVGEWVNPRYHDTNPIGTVDEDGTAIAVGPVLPLPSANVSKKAENGSPAVYIPIARYNIQASAGFGALVEHEQVVEYVAYDLGFLRNRLRRDPKNLVLIEARGDSMEPTIRDGDILTVDITPDQPLQNAQLYVLRVADDLMVKRLERRLKGGLIVHSDNARYAPETVPPDELEQLQILGQVLLVSAPPR